MKRSHRFNIIPLFTLLILMLVLVLRPTPGFGQASKVIAVAGGGGHTVILKDDGTVWGWGKNDYGQLGNGNTHSSATPAHSAVPVQVKDPGGFGYLNGIKAIAAGENHTVALATDDTVWAWGANNHGQLGIGNTENKTTPVRVHLPPGVQIKAIAAGYNHTVALATGGAVYAWGSNSYGQLGTGGTMDMATPQTVAGLTNVSSVAAGGNHTAAVAAGAVKAWGANGYGQLGCGDNLDRSAPAAVQRELTGRARAIDKSSITLEATASSSSDYYNGMTVTVTGDWSGTGTITRYAGSTRKATVAWATPPGTLAPGGNYNYSIPTVSNVKAVACGRDHTLALAGDGAAWCWGYNGFGQLGDKTTIGKNVPVRVSALSDVIDISGGEWHSLFLKSDGTVWACGRNDHLQLGNTSTAAGNPAPAQVKGLAAVIDIDAGGAHSLALLPDGKLYGWGSYQFGQIGRVAANSAVPLLIDTTPPMNNDAPTVISTDPDNNARDIVPDKVITVTFSEPIFAGPYFNGITMDQVTQANAPVNVTIAPAITGSELTMNQTATALLDGNKYRIYIPAGAVQDADGNALAVSYTFTFTTRDITPPVVISTIPADGDTGVAVAVPVQATFSEDMDPLTINKDTFLLYCDLNGDGIYETKVPGLVSYSAPTKTATFVPLASLQPSIGYQAVITDLVCDLAGNRMPRPYVFSFNTARDTIAPTVISHNPARNELNVRLSNTITVTFSEGIFSTGNGAVSLTDMNTGRTVTSAQVVFSANELIIRNYILQRNTVYEVKIPGRLIRDAAGNTMAFDYSFKFTTTPDDIPPRVTVISPGSGAAGVPVNAKIVVTFSEPIEEGGNLWNGIRLQSGTNPSIAINKVISGNKLIVTPVQDLNILTPYNLIIPLGSVWDLNGNGLANTFVLSFRTGSNTGGATLSVARDIYGIPGYTVEAPVTIEQGSGLTGFQFDLEYDQERLTPTGVVPGNDLAVGWEFQHSNVSTTVTGKVNVIGYKTQGPALAGDYEKQVVRVLFRVDNYAPDGDAPLSFGDLAPAVDGINKAVHTRDGKIIITRRQLGDVNGDGQIDVQDVMLAVRFALNEITPDPLEKFAADVNRDGTVDVEDVVQIVNKSLGRY